VVLIALVIGLALVFEQDRSTKSVVMPATGVITVTGFAHWSAKLGSTDSTKVTLTSVQATTLRQIISTLPRFPFPGGRPILCSEEAKVFTISVSRVHHESANWVATAELCPEGALYIKDSHGPQQAPLTYCDLQPFIASLFPKVRVAETISEMKYCAYVNHF
jgi:hypothetical protein